MPVKNPVTTLPTRNEAKQVVTKKPSVTTTAVTSLYQQQASPAIVPAERDTKTIPAAEQPAPLSDAEITQSVLQQIPLLTERSARFQRSVPTIDYAIHVYSENENAGFVNLNGAIRRIGSEIVPGLRVIAILNDSVVLDYNGSQFRLPALNSWMNFK